MIEELEYDFGRALKSIRESRGYSQKQLGEIMGIDPNRISNWELGYAKPNLDTFRALCIALNCAPGNMIALSPSEHTDDEYNLLKGFRLLDDAGQHTMLAVLESQLAVRSSSDG